MTINERLKKYKLSRGLKSCEFAEILNVETQQLNRWLKGIVVSATFRDLIIDVLGDDFLQYRIRATCHCGKIFIPKMEGQKNCGKECARVGNLKKAKALTNKMTDEVLKIDVGEMSMSQRLRYERLVRGLTLNDVAKMLNMSKSSINNYEKKGNVPSNKFIKRCAEAFNENFERYFTKITCQWCGNEMVPIGNQIYCSAPCQKESATAKKMSQAEYMRRYREKPLFGMNEESKNKRVSCVGIKEVEERARLSGMSYGIYISTMRMKGRDL